MGKEKAAEKGVSSFGDLHNHLSRLRDGWIFRGHSDLSWRLVPKAGRTASEVEDKVVFEAWKRKAIEFLSPRPVSNWDWLAIAQHHGLSTRLLDWTTNPLNAAYFAVCEPALRPAVIHAAMFESGYGGSADDVYSDPMLCEGVSIFRPSGVVARITRQGGLFTIHNPPSTSLEELPKPKDERVVTLRRIVIAERYRDRLRSDLAFYGVTSASLFPDLDGLSRFLNWSVESGQFRD